LVGRWVEVAGVAVGRAAAARGRPRVALVVGEPGIGKSRLLHEFRRHLAGTPHLWVEGHCASYGQATAFLPIAEGWRRTFGIEDRDDEVHAIAKVERGIEAFGDDMR
jgi:predicted ATPase